MIDPAVSTQVPNQLSMHWVEVADERGRTHLESRWSVPSQVGSASGATHAA
ncbi:hypothetical protein [Nocardioides sp.]|jgi:hypothetical protein|uniref:hypothetical protein n=1 Tax=Nocardioides sp. TaxID=35761 RepID=UPI0031FE57DB|nr:hypothetical protein [Nocardioides sp.]